MKLHPVIPFLLLSALARAAEPPNLVVIMADDLGYADVGFNGCSDIPTPNIDRIAKGGVVFTDAYVTYTVCAPSRAGFITGRYPQRFGFERNPAYQPHNPGIGLPRSEQTLAEALRPAGYTSALVGKWHLGAHDDFHPLKRGFDEFFGHVGGGKRYFPELLTKESTTDAKNEWDSYHTLITRGFTPVKTTGYLTDEFTRESLDFIRRRASANAPQKPFFLFIAYNAPHGPLEAPADEIAKFGHIQDEKRRTYAALISGMDRGIGQILDLLDEQRLADNTLVVFLSDNGGAVYTHGSRNTPLRGAKAEPWEGGWRVPMAALWPAVFPAGLKFAQPVSSMDIFATIAAANALQPDTQRPLDGVNLAPFVRGEKAGAPHQRIYLRMFDHGAFAMREGNYKIIRSKRAKNSNDEAAVQLYDLAGDVSEKRNLAATEPERLQAMRRDYEQWNTQLIAPAFQGLETKK
jgi:arylsulfatase A-like enzyme